MTSGAYSFIDIAALDAVRVRFAAGDALAILSADLETVLWANGAGAAVFAYADIEAIMGAPTQLGAAARRQIAATPGYPAIGRDKGVAVRLSSGLTSRVVPFLASGISLPGGEHAILLALPAPTTEARGPQEIAKRALAGFSEAGYFAALVDDRGGVTASTAGFGGLGIGHEALRELVDEAQGARDRLVKRLVPAGNALFPAGFARLTDDPAQHLLVVVGEDQSARRRPDAVSPPEAVRETPLEQDNHQRAPTPVSPAQAFQSDAVLDKPANPAPVDRWYFQGVETVAAPAAAEMPVSAPAPVAAAQRRMTSERQAGPFRFVWRTDAEGRFSAISPDFAAAVGASSADVIGRSFRDVATAFGFDAGGEIAGLLERRDTWSGRSVLWPISGTDLRAPVDLAALPVYGRDRSFEGFRGFGVARVGDAVADPTALGLALTEDRSEADRPEPPAEEALGEAPKPEDDPFRGEVPALSIDNTPERRFTDKVIRLAEHRQPGGERVLTPIERSAFREIGDRLKKDGAPPRPVPLPPAAVEEAAPPAHVSAAAEPDAAEVEAEEANAALAGESSGGADGEDQPAVAQETPTADRDEGEEIAPRSAEMAKPERLDFDEDRGGSETSAEPVTGSALTTGESLRQAHGLLQQAPEQEEPTFDLSVLSRLPVPVLIHAGDRLHYANPEFFGLTGYESIADLEKAGGLGALFVDSYETEAGAGDHNLRLQTSGGEEFPVEALLQSVPWKSGKALLLAIRPVARHLHKSRVQDEDLEARITELRTILDTATDGVVLITNEGDIRSISKPAEALFGFDNSHVAGEAFTSLFAVESQRAAREYLNGLSDNGVASVLNDGREVIGREAKGRFIPLFMTIGKLPGDSGYCAVVRDITQWKRAEEELTQARAQAERTSSQKTDFLARVSHEIRTPLNAIIGFSELMIDERFGPVANDRYRDYLRDINRSGNHVLDLVNDLLDISKIEAGEQEMSYEAVSLNDALAECVAMLQPQANRERVIIRSSFVSKLPEVVADMRSIRQIALNLLSNAIRYTPAGGQVIISTAYETSGEIALRVRDTGIGMTQAEIEQALKPFKQINASKRARGDGTGLGLPLTKAMVEANRARFSINSTPGEGTMVEIIFPSTRVLAD